MLDIHRNGYLRPIELAELINEFNIAVNGTPSLPPGTKDVGLVSLSQWVRSSGLTANSPAE